VGLSTVPNYYPDLCSYLDSLNLSEGQKKQVVSEKMLNLHPKTASALCWKTRHVVMRYQQQRAMVPYLQAMKLVWLYLETQLTHDYETNQH